jgi:transcriptional regulator GlxA family with amidase domain
MLSQVRRLAAGARRVTSVCSGAFVLAAVGLLDGRRAATHWAECDLLRQAYPAVTVDTDAIYVRDGNVWTSAGVTAGIDLPWPWSPMGHRATRGRRDPEPGRPSRRQSDRQRIIAL